MGLACRLLLNASVSDFVALSFSLPYQCGVYELKSFFILNCSNVHKCPLWVEERGIHRYNENIGSINSKEKTESSCIKMELLFLRLWVVFW